MGERRDSNQTLALVSRASERRVKRIDVDDDHVANKQFKLKKAKIFGKLKLRITGGESELQEG